MRIRRSFLIAVACAALVVGFFEIQHKRWVGGYELSVQLHSHGPRKIARITAGAYYDKEIAAALRSGQLTFDFSSQPFVPSLDHPFKVRVKSVGSDSGLGREISYTNEQLLVLRIEYEDGAVEIVTAEIPDGRKQRHIEVDIP